MPPTHTDGRGWVLDGSILLVSYHPSHITRTEHHHIITSVPSVPLFCKPSARTWKMSDTRAPQSIFAHTSLCVKLFQKQARPSKSAPGREQDGHRAALRFQKWCSASGAHLTGPQSLDERLRDASKIRRLVLDCLLSVENALLEMGDEDHSPGESRGAQSVPDTSSPGGADSLASHRRRQLTKAKTWKSLGPRWKPPQGRESRLAARPWIKSSRPSR